MNINQIIVKKLKERNYKITTAESITGGKLISSLIEIPGASKIIEQSYIVYSNKAKINVLNVAEYIISKYGVVSEEVALEMARKTKIISNSNIIITTTGEAGPIVNEQNIVNGTVCFGLIINNKEYVYTEKFTGDRLNIINKAVIFILNELNNELEKSQ